MRKFVIALMIGVLLIAGTVQAASVSANAVKTLVSRTLTKVCAANDNRCLRLVSGASGTLEKALPALSLIGRTNWLTLALSFLLPVAGDFAFNLGKKIRLFLTKTDEDVIVSSVEKTQDAEDIPVAAVPGISSVDGYADEWVSSLQVALPDPKTLVLTESAGFLASGASAGSGSFYVSHFQDAQKYRSGRWTKGDYLEYYALSNGIFSLMSAKPDYWYFTNNDVVPYYARSGSSSYRVFKGYMSPIVWVKDGIKNDGFILIGYDRMNSITVCPQGQAYKYGYGVCETLAEKIPDYDQAADPNAKVRSELSAAVVAEPNVPLNKWLDTLTDQEKNAMVSEELLAAFIDELWKQTAAQDGYEGEPYVSGKITPELVSSVASDFPTIGDALETIDADGTQLTQDRNTGKLHDSTTDPATPGQGSNPSTTPDAPADTKPGTIGGTNTGTVGDQNINVDVKLDLGDYPDIKQPTLEEPPSAASILDPIFNLFPNLKDYRVPDHASECPRPSFEMFGATFEIDAHCDLLEDQRETVGFIMTLVWSICALWIVLKA